MIELPPKDLLNAPGTGEWVAVRTSFRVRQQLDCV